MNSQKLIRKPAALEKSSINDMVPGAVFSSSDLPGTVSGNSRTTISNEVETTTSPRTSSVISRTTGRQTTFFLSEEHARLFDKVLAYRAENEERHTFAAALEKFASYPSGTDIVKLVYGASRYDYILRYEDENDDKKAIREKFEKALLEHGLLIQHDRTLEEKKVYVKIITTFQRLCFEAEQMKLIFPLATSQFSTKNGDTVQQVSRGVFRADQLEKFLPNTSEKSRFELEETFFSDSQRVILTNDTISHIRCQHRTKTFGISDLLHKQIYLKYYPLHSGKIDDLHSIRGQLQNQWGTKWNRPPPLDHIRAYFGEKIAFYFAWLGLYVKCLWLLAIVGLFVFIYGIVKYVRKPEGDNSSLLALMFDNELTIAYAFFVSIWSTLFLELWKRHNARLAYAWSVMNIEQDEAPRQDWVADSYRKSPITGKIERYYSDFKRRLKMCISVMVVIICLIILGVSVGALMLFKAWSAQHFSGDEAWKSSVSTGVLSLVIILLLTTAYTGIAEKITSFENHRTQTDFERSLTIKTFLFDFISVNASLFYIGIVKQLSGGKNVFGSGIDDQCGYGSCMVDLTIQLLIILIGKQLIGQVQEIFIPWLMRARTTAQKKKRMKERSDKFRRNEENFARKSQYQLMQDTEIPPWVEEDALNKFTGLIGEYKEMAIQFGFITLFVCSFPLGPLFALLNNITEVKGDAHKFLVEFQRPVPLRASNIGAWETILTGISFTAVLTNATLIACTSEYFQKNVLDGRPEHVQTIIRLAFIMVWEHVVFGLKFLVSFLIPDVPEDVVEALARDRYRARVHLEGLPPAEDDQEAVAMMHSK